ncbi:hypothetical protein ACA910_002387 [Epithemia clementina (nom. ined.)]
MDYSSTQWKEQHKIASADPRSAYTQQWSLLCQSGTAQPDPRKQFFTDLSTILDAFSNQGYECMVMLDANENFSGRKVNLPNSPRSTILLIFTWPATSVWRTPHLPLILVAPHSPALTTYLAPPKWRHIPPAPGFWPSTKCWASDHRGLFVDVNLAALLRGDAPPLDTPSGRLLHSNNPTHVRKYRSALHQYCEDHAIYHRATRLETKMQTKSFPLVAKDEAYLTQQLDKIQNDITCGMLAAEKKCGATGRHPWSPILVQARQKLLYWGLWRLELRLHRDFSLQRTAIQQKIQWTTIPHFTRPPTLNTIKKLQSEARLQVRSCEKKAQALRDDFLAERAAHWADLHNTSAAGILRTLQAAETERTMFAKLRLLRGGTAMGGLSALKVPDDADPSADWQLIVDQNEITTRLIQRNNDHFGQANGTPFTVQPLLDIIGRNADHDLASVRDALQCPENSDATTALLHHLNDYRLPISCQFTGQELKQSFKVWRENTSTSPHGTHLGLYKALTAPDAPPTAPQPPANAASPAPPLPLASLLPSHIPSSLPADRNNLARQQSTTLAPPCSTYPLPPPVQHPPVIPPTPSPFFTNNNNHIPPHSLVPPQSNEIAGPLHPAIPSIYPSVPGPTSPNNQIFDVMAILLTMAFLFGLIVHKWTCIHNAMLEKQPGNPRLDKLRVIHILDALWNQGMGTMWARQLQPNCEQHSALHDGQWGSRHRRQCIDVVTLKQLTYELSRVTQTDLITFDNDAKSCYDRIVMA